ncbi:MAG: sel1 repeat family protein [Sulfuriflexus sp.]|nr:sel1 repeat family protein [Sulfuriflexus sp.]
MKKVLCVLSLFFITSVVVADTSDYIWNQQFEKKSAKAAEGNLKAQYDVGNMYLKGQGTMQDAKQAFNWFQKAAAKGYSRAQYKLGYLYHRGEGTKKDSGKAFKWVSKSAGQGYKPAMYYLGKLYAAGDGVKVSIQKALKWHKKAHAAGYNPAKREVERLEAKLALQQQRKEEARFDPRPVQVAKVAPKRKPAPRPKARVGKQKSAGSKLSKQALKNLITGNEWQIKGKPAVLLPSPMTKCKIKAGNLVCESKEMEYDEAYGVISYTMRATYSDFNNKGEFTGEYHKYITLIFPNDPDDPDVVIPLEYGDQKKELMRCRATGRSLTCYRGAKREKVTYSRI